MFSTNFISRRLIISLMLGLVAAGTWGDPLLKGASYLQGFVVVICAAGGIFYLLMFCAVAKADTLKVWKKSPTQRR